MFRRGSHFAILLISFIFCQNLRAGLESAEFRARLAKALVAETGKHPLEIQLRALMKKDDEAFLVIGDAHQNAFFPKENFSTKKHPGHCDAIEAVNLSLFTNIKFEKGEADSNEEIEKKLIAAASRNELVTIRSPYYLFKKNGMNELFFMKLMELTWDEDGNPLRRALQAVQGRVGADKSDLIWRRTFDANEELSNQQFSAHLNDLHKGIPFRLAIDTARKGSLHALVVVGFLKGAKEHFPLRMLVMDSNHPKQLQVLTLDFDDKGRYIVMKGNYPAWKERAAVKVLKRDYWQASEKEREVWESRAERAAAPTRFEWVDYKRQKIKAIPGVYKLKD